MTKKQLQEDVFFLAKRGLKSGSISFVDNERDTGSSSNSIVGIAYGIVQLSQQCLPSDISDMKSCERMWDKLPEHRKDGNALKAIEAARNCNYFGKVKQE